MGDGDVWCKSGRVPIRAGDYLLGGRTVTVHRSRTGKFYASRDGKYAPGLIWQLRAHLELDQHISRPYAAVAAAAPPIRTVRRPIR